MFSKKITQYLLRGFVSSSLFVLLPYAPITVTHAAPPGTCELASQVSELRKLQGGTGEKNPQGLLTELQARKNILTTILSCSLKEVRGLSLNINDLSLPSESLKPVKNRLGNAFNETIAYYEAQKLKIDTLGIQGSKDLAKNILEWRIGNYAPLSEKTVSFILWAKNQYLIKAANQRSAQITQTIKALKLTEDADIKKLLADANVNLLAAEETNLLTEKAFINDEEHYADSLKESLEKLALTYQNFFDLSEAVNKILPHY
ncbi:MAG: hypothetical protein AAB652_00310 [Patescibacteria group bacterium]